MMATDMIVRILNVVLMRPIMSPSDFVQMKGRGTKHDFKINWIDHKQMRTISLQKMALNFSTSLVTVNILKKNLIIIKKYHFHLYLKW